MPIFRSTHGRRYTALAKALRYIVPDVGQVDGFPVGDGVQQVLLADDLRWTVPAPVVPVHLGRHNAPAVAGRVSAVRLQNNSPGGLWVDCVSVASPTTGFVLVTGAAAESIDLPGAPVTPISATGAPVASRIEAGAATLAAKPQAWEALQLATGEVEGKPPPFYLPPGQHLVVEGLLNALALEALLAFREVP